MTPFESQLGRRAGLGLALVLLLVGCSGLTSQVSQTFAQGPPGPA
jgi:hypothetical protein